MQNRLQIFNSLLGAYEPIHLYKISQLVLDSLLLTEESEALERVILYNMFVYSMSRDLILPSAIFVMLDDSKEFDPIEVNHKVSFVYKIYDNYIIEVILTLHIDHSDKTIYVTASLNGKSFEDGEWKITNTATNCRLLTFEELAAIRESK